MVELATVRGDKKLMVNLICATNEHRDDGICRWWNAPRLSVGLAPGATGNCRWKALTNEVPIQTNTWFTYVNIRVSFLFGCFKLQERAVELAQIWNCPHSSLLPVTHFILAITILYIVVYRLPLPFLNSLIWDIAQISIFLYSYRKCTCILSLSIFSVAIRRIECLAVAIWQIAVNPFRGCC